MEFNTLLIEVAEGIATITINRPKALNALNAEVLLELACAFEGMEKNNDVKVIILTGAGEKSFVAGADIAHMEKMSPLEARAFGLLGQNTFNRIEQHSKPVIAAINGFALGGGCELAMSCDIRLASENAKFGQPEVNLGVMPGFAGSQRLPRLVGKAAAKELLFTADIIPAQEALRIGLVNKVYPLENLLEKAREMAKKIASKGEIAVRFCKEAVNNGMEMEVNKACIYEADLFALCFSTQDREEGMKAFLEKRPAKFTGR